MVSPTNAAAAQRRSTSRFLLDVASCRTSAGGCATVIVALFVAVAVFSNRSLQETATGRQPERVRRSSSSSPRRLYVDLGANCGNSYYRMKYGWLPGSNETLKYPSPDAWEAYLWECSPQMIDWYLNDLVKNETNVVLVPKAAFTSNGEASFHVTSGQEGYKKEDMPNAACDPASAYNPGGASTLQGSAKRASHTLTYTVETVDFLEWHKGLELREGDVVHMKMDIEGPEKEIIEKFLNDDPTNQICFWHVFWIEYHAEIFEAGTPEYEAHKKFERELPGKFEQKCGRKLWPNIHP